MIKELPVLRVAWLRRLADFHSSRKKYAEEATCHFQIYVTLRQAARLHDSIWNSSPFQPWTIERSDGLHINGEGPASSEIDDHGLDSFNDLDEYSGDETFFSGYSNSGRQIETKNSFRRLFYRVPGSLRVPPGDWDGTGNANAFYGVTSVSEYNMTTSNATNSVKEMEEGMFYESCDEFLISPPINGYFMTTLIF